MEGTEMSKTVKKRLSLITVFAIIITCFGNMALAFDNGYKDATEYTTSVTDYITSESQVDWYKFTLSADQVPAPYSITLVVPDDCLYNFDLRYRSGSTGRPSVLSNTTITNSARRKIMKGVFNEAGTYFVRIYSQNGTYSSANSYKLTVSHNKNGTRTFAHNKDFPQAESTDWCVCADILGNYTFEYMFQSAVTGRNYENAYAFITSDYASDSPNGFSGGVKATPEQMAIAADYIYSGDLMLNPRFKVETDKIYEIEELMNYLWGFNQPVVFYLAPPTIAFDGLKKYVILEDVNIGRNTISYFNPSSKNEETVDYDDFLLNGFVYGGVNVLYNGTNILNSNTPSRIQIYYN